MDKELRNALRSEILGIIDRLPESQKLDMNKTLKANENCEWHNQIYIYKCHHHQREEFLNQKRSVEWTDNDKKRKHANSRYIEKRERQARTISKLIRLDDQLLEKFYNDEIQPVFTDNQYYSPKVSETDDECSKQKIVIRDIKWQSSTVRRMRKRMYNYVEFAPNEEKAPVNAPAWTKTEYNRLLKSYIGRYSNVNYSPIHEDMNNVKEENDNHNGNYADSFKENNGNREKRSRSLILTEYNSDYEKDDD
ncbi:10632_t:CDS:2 [Funneliformis caledonium]|uniref:10632_t:CDS:1 n=1 Tax=Funneliformis caledonium TaxID=1117310 RepID=A0A9N8YQ38_9GLOM|nr:10632_t:CDS:2 [Funneliformis caledonium]